MKRFAFCHKVNPGSLLRFGALPPGGAGRGKGAAVLTSALSRRLPSVRCLIFGWFHVVREPCGLGGAWERESSLRFSFNRLPHATGWAVRAEGNRPSFLLYL